LLVALPNAGKLGGYKARRPAISNTAKSEVLKLSKLSSLLASKPSSKKFL
jgi:hypothetical protein